MPDATDLVSSVGDFGLLREWLKQNQDLRALLKEHGLRGVRRSGWLAEQQNAAIEAIDGLPKAVRRSHWIREQGKAERPAERQGQARIQLLVRHIDALLEHQRVPQPARRGNGREALREYLYGSGPCPDSWRTLVRLLSDDLRLAIRLDYFAGYSLAEGFTALRPQPRLAEQIEWLLEPRRYRGRFHATPERRAALLRLRGALQALPANARAGRPDSANKPLIRAGVIAWKTFGLPMEFKYSNVHDKLSGRIVPFLRDLLKLAGLPQPSNAALNQQLRTLRRV